jgi:ribosomal protein S18 acetylase RimI-like enzyme
MARDDWRFAPAEPTDADAMRALARTAYAKYVPRIGREPGPMVADYGAIAESGGALLVWREAELVGFLVTVLEDDALLIENVAVSPDEQGAGLGSHLITLAEEQAMDAGKPRIRLYTNEKMIENIAFYAGRGFVETHRATEDGFTRVFMSKQLGDLPAMGQ